MSAGKKRTAEIAGLDFETEVEVGNRWVRVRIDNHRSGFVFTGTSLLKIIDLQMDARADLLEATGRGDQ